MKRHHTKIELRKILAMEVAGVQLHGLAKYCSYYSYGFNGERGKSNHWMKLYSLFYQHNKYLIYRLNELKKQKYHPPLDTVI